MRVVVAVNCIAELDHRQTTSLLIASLVRAGTEVYLAGVGDFSMAGTADSNRHLIHAARIPSPASETDAFDSRDVESLARQHPLQSALELQPASDLVLIRTNPGRDRKRISAHDFFLDFCNSARLTGVRVLNDPHAVRFFASKAALSVLDPRYRPEMIVSHDPELIQQFVRHAPGDCVIKPVLGSRGQDVIRVAAGQSDLEQICAGFEGTAVVAQHFVTAPHPGDKRVVVVGGNILEVNGHYGGIHRKPAAGDFRANIHAGGSPHPLHLSEDERTTVEHAADYLHENGIWLAGIDLIGGKIIEFNVYSTGGLYYANQFSGLDFSACIVSQLMQNQA